MIPSPDSDPFGDSDSGSGSRKRWNHNTSTRHSSIQLSPVGVVLADYMEYVPLGEVQAGVLARDVAVVGGVVVEEGAKPDPFARSGVFCWDNIFLLNPF